MDRSNNLNIQTEDNETNRYLNIKTNEGQQATGVAHQGHAREDRGGSGGHGRQEVTTLFSIECIWGCVT